MKNFTLNNLEIGDKFHFPGSLEVYVVVGYRIVNGVRLCSFKPLYCSVDECLSSLPICKVL